MSAPKVLFAVFAIVAIQGCTAKAVEKTQLEVLAANAKTLAENVTTTLGLQDLNSQKIVKALNEQTQALADSLETASKKLKAELSAHEGEFKKGAKQIEEEITKIAESLKKVIGPDATAKATEIRTKFDDGFKNAASEIEKLVKSVQPQAEEAQNNIRNLAKTSLDQLLEIGKTIQSKIDTAIADHQKTHKH